MNCGWLNKSSDVFDSLSRTCEFGVIPQENSIFGSVIETYDMLRKPSTGFVCGELVLEVQHCLLVRAGVRLDQVEQVMSHEQVKTYYFDLVVLYYNFVIAGYRTVQRIFEDQSSERWDGQNTVHSVSRTSPAREATKLCSNLLKNLRYLV